MSCTKKKHERSQTCRDSQVISQKYLEVCRIRPENGIYSKIQARVYYAPATRQNIRLYVKKLNKLRHNTFPLPNLNTYRRAKKNTHIQLRVHKTSKIVCQSKENTTKYRIKANLLRNLSSTQENISIFRSFRSQVEIHKKSVCCYVDMSRCVFFTYKNVAHIFVLCSWRNFM